MIPNCFNPFKNVLACVEIDCPRICLPSPSMVSDKFFLSESNSYLSPISREVDSIESGFSFLYWSVISLSLKDPYFCI